MTQHESETAPANMEPTPEPRTRRYRKRTKVNAVARPPLPVRALWEGASEEDRKRAHETCTSLLELWLGKTTKQVILARLQIPPLRLWQLSQQALSGMAAGLLVQPKTRPNGAAMVEKPEQDLKALLKRNAQLEQENKDLKNLIELLRELPGHRMRELPAKLPASAEGGATATPPESFRPRRGTQPKPTRRGAKSGRKVARRRPDPTTGAKTARVDLESESADAPKLEDEGTQASGT